MENEVQTLLNSHTEASALNIENNCRKSNQTGYILCHFYRLHKTPQTLFKKKRGKKKRHNSSS